MAVSICFLKIEQVATKTNHERPSKGNGISKTLGVLQNVPLPNNMLTTSEVSYVAYK